MICYRGGITVRARSLINVLELFKIEQLNQSLGSRQRLQIIENCSRSGNGAAGRRIPGPPTLWRPRGGFYVACTGGQSRRPGPSSEIGLFQARALAAHAGTISRGPGPDRGCCRLGRIDHGPPEPIVRLTERLAASWRCPCRLRSLACRS